jgi:hypothetical protein
MKLVEIAEPKKMSDVVDALKTEIQKLFPNSFLQVSKDSNLMDSLSIRFSIEPKSEWKNGIFHNAQYIILMIDEKGKRYETGQGPYQVEVLSSQLPIKFRKKTGTLDAVVGHVVKFFTNLKKD